MGESAGDCSGELADFHRLPLISEKTIPISRKSSKGDRKYTRIKKSSMTFRHKKRSVEQVGAWTGDPGTLYGVKSAKACLELNVGRADGGKKTSRYLSSKRKKMWSCI